MVSGFGANRSPPAEWARHRAVWSAWPAHPEEWGDEIEAVRAEVAELFRAIHDHGRGEQVRLLVRDEANRDQAAAALQGLEPDLCVGAPYGDIWLRDTGPVFVRRGDGALAAACFRFNGWGGRFQMAGDTQVADYVARRSSCPPESYPWVLEGGAVDSDGEGTLLTTEQCLLNPNRNPGQGRFDVERSLASALGARRVLWLRRGLQNDHTDGHVDTLVRFVGSAKVVCMDPASQNDPNRECLLEILADLESMEDAQGRNLEVHTIPSPGAVYGPEGQLLPASYVNFYIANSRVVVPTYGAVQDADAVAGIAELFPGREVVGRSARTLIRGGGAFHCITQQEPEVPSVLEEGSP